MDKPKLLVVEDEEAIRSQMKWALCDEYEVVLAEDRASAIEHMRREKPTLVVLDLGLPPCPRTADEGLACLRDVLTMDPEAKVIVVTGNQEKENALKAIELGAYDFFLKPAEQQEVKVVLKRALHLSTLVRENIAAKDRVAHEEFEEMVGESPQMQRIFSAIRKVAATDAPVLIEGESGTGKELIAKAIHRSSSRHPSGPFIAINCGAIPENLLESELFGHEKGSFTGADAQKKGKIEYSNGGTLFLDEIGELSLALQVKLLRFLQEYEVERVGGREAIAVNARVIAATNRELDKEIREGRFREDLYYRLGVVTVQVPPLRDRGEDVVVLAKIFLKKSSFQYRKPIIGFRSDALAAIRSYSWPGNIRELENRIRRAVIMSDRKLLAPADLDLASIDDAAPSDSLKEIRGQAEREHIRKALQKNSWNITKAAGELGISRPTLHDFMKKHRISRDRE